VASFGALAGDSGGQPKGRFQALAGRKLGIGKGTAFRSCVVSANVIGMEMA